jgi:pimeloyl-ACP methyl ester carboxylesterase
VVDFVKERNFEDVTVIGESIGTGVAAYHTSLYPPESLLLISPFSDLVAIAARHYWYYPVSLLVNNAFDNEKLLRGYKGRVLIVHGEADTIIPAALGEKLFHSLDTSDRKLFIVPGAGHNDIFESPSVDETLSQFMKS